MINTEIPTQQEETSAEMLAVSIMFEIRAKNHSLPQLLFSFISNTEVRLH